MDVVKLNVKMRWWVWPFFWLAYAAVLPFWLFVDLDEYAARLGRFIVDHGVKFKVE